MKLIQEEGHILWLFSSSPPQKNQPSLTAGSNFQLTMACVTPPSPFSLHFSTFSLKPKPKLKPHSLPSLFTKPRKLTVNSIDVSKEDTTPSPSPTPTPEPAPEAENLDPRRLEEKFAVLNTGIYECRSCGYKYDEAVGDPSYPIPPGFQFEKLPDDWRCPTCGAAQSFFESKSVQIAGFAQNQQYGLGGNSLTSGQKTVLIYGSLLLFFALFLGGYFLQQFLFNSPKVTFCLCWIGYVFIDEGLCECMYVLYVVTTQ